MSRLVSEMGRFLGLELQEHSEALVPRRFCSVGVAGGSKDRGAQEDTGPVFPGLIPASASSRASRPIYSQLLCLFVTCDCLFRSSWSSSLPLLEAVGGGGCADSPRVRSPLPPLLFLPILPPPPPSSPSSLENILSSAPCPHCSRSHRGTR